MKINNYNIGKTEFDSFNASKAIRLHGKLKSDEKIKIIYGAIIEIVKKNKVEMFFDKVKNKLLLSEGEK